MSHEGSRSTPPPLRVLIADDSHGFREILRWFLDSIPGVDVVGVVNDGVEAVRMAADAAPDVVLMDLVMPRLGGCEATRQVKLAARAPRVILLSVCGDDELRQAAALAGADGFLNKRDVGSRLSTVLGVSLDA